MLKPFDVKSFVTLAGPLNASQRAGLTTLLGYVAEDTQLTRPTEAAYMLATVQHECANTFQPIMERGTPDYFSKYDRPPLSTILGNKKPGDGFIYRGRGYSMLTGLGNYLRFQDLVKCGLVHTPDLALIPVYAYAILSTGINRGKFTGRALSLYVNERETNYTEARRTVNGLDKAELIATYARRFEGIFRQVYAPIDSEVRTV